MLLTTQVILGFGFMLVLALAIKLLKEPETLLKKVFSLYILGITVWVGVVFLNTFLESVLMAKVVFASAAFFLTAQLWFAKLFPGGLTDHSASHYWSVAAGLFLSAMSFWNGALFKTIEFNPNGYVTVENGFLSIPYALFVLLCTVYPIMIFWKKYRSTTEVSIRAQLKYLLLGFSIFFLVSTFTNSVLPVFFGIYFFNAIGPVFSLILAAFVFYIIWRHQFLDIKIIIQRGFVYSILLSLIIGAYFAALLGLSHIANIAMGVTAPLSALAIMLLGVLTVPPMERYLRKKTDFLFFKDRYDYSAALQELTNILGAHATTKPLVAESMNTLTRILRVESAEFIEKKREIPGAAYAVPIISRREHLGTLALGKKRSGDPLRPKDISLLNTFAGEFTIALQKAKLYGSVRAHARELEKKVEERTKHLKELQEYQRRMTDDISHAIQTPVTVMKGALEKAKRLKNYTRMARVLEQSVGNLSRLAYDVLYLSKLESLPEVKREIFSLSETASDILEYVAIVCTEHGITLRHAIERELEMYGDTLQIEELLTNLLSNAVKYTRGAKKRNISVDVRRNGSQAEIRVEDTGVGIAADSLPHIFERFYKAENCRKEGTGLGLSICKRIAELHGGTISAESLEGQGSTFLVRLPLVRERKAA